MDTTQDPDDFFKRNVEDDDTEGQRFTHRAIPDEAPAADDLVKRTAVDDEDDTEGQKATHR